MNRRAALLTLMAACLLTACQSYTWTERHYRPYTAQQFPPVPPKVPVPLLDKKPEAAHTTIGRLRFSASASAEYMFKAVEHNARKVGADAAVISRLSRTEQPWQQWVPPQTVYHPITHVEEVRTQCDNDKKPHRTTYSHTTWVPELQPGYMDYGVDVTHSIDAYMIRYKAR